MSETQQILQKLGLEDQEIKTYLALLELPFPEIKVEVYKGLEDFKSVLNDRIKTGGDMYAFGVDEAKFKAKSH